MCVFHLSNLKWRIACTWQMLCMMRCIRLQTDIWHLSITIQSRCDWMRSNESLRIPRSWFFQVTSHLSHDMVFTNKYVWNFVQFHSRTTDNYYVSKCFNHTKTFIDTFFFIPWWLLRRRYSWSDRAGLTYIQIFMTFWKMIQPFPDSRPKELVYGYHTAGL